MQTPAIDAAFPGGNIVVESIDGDVVRLHQDLRDTPRFWFYWCFRISGAAGRTVRFEFTDGHVFGPLGPCRSSDGWDWEYLGRDMVENDAFATLVPTDPTYYAFCPTYTESHLQRFLRTRPEIACGTLTTSEQGRPVEHLVVESRLGECSVLITARHHACEAPASFVLEGILDFRLRECDEAEWLREHVDLHAVPFVDKDGVENGDQGKCRRPHDHWEDYTSAPTYASPRELMRQAPLWRGRMRIVLDLHCPSVRDTRMLAVEPPEPYAEQTRKLVSILRETQEGDLRLRPEDSVRFGQAWNTGHNGCTVFFAESGSAQAALLLEIPYALVGGKTVTRESARTLGIDLGRAISLYLQN